MLNFLVPRLRLRTLVTLLGLAALAGTLWYAGPYAAVFGYAPLATGQDRVNAIALLVVLAFGIAAFRFWRTRRANAHLIRKLMDDEGPISSFESQSLEEVTILRERFQNALSILRRKQLRTSTGSGFLLDLPWYLIIGPPGSGKSTILRNSGLNFPLAEQVGADVLAGAGGTRNCDWWFTDQAVLLDTAGRYTTQDSNAIVDRAAWRGFLNLLREFRRRQPLNGVLLALSLSDILTRDEETRLRQIDIFRQRLQELTRTFGLRLPVYLLITKSDLVAGFSEFFNDLADVDREQIWGMTFTPQQADTGLAAAFEAGFAELLARLLEHMPYRLHDPRDTTRRQEIFTFPQQFGAVRELAGKFVNEVFRPGRYELAPMLRGVFFTSGTQVGTPIDRLMGAYARAFGLSTALALPPNAKARTYFVHQLLSDVVFAESGLVGTDRKLERRLAITHIAGYAASAAVLAGLSLLWLGAYHHNAGEAATLTSMAARLQQLRAIESAEADLGSVLAVLDQASAMAHINDRSGFVDNWVTQAGLSNGDVLGAQAGSVYRRLLVSDLLPVMTKRMRERLADAAGANMPNPVLHQMLAAYLMLGQPARFRRPVIASWMQSDSQAAYPSNDSPRHALDGHYRALLALLPIVQPMDPTLVSTVRARLIEIPQAETIYAQLRSDADRDRPVPPFTLASVVGTAADTAFADQAGAGIRAAIPGFFTRDGFYDGFVARLPGIIRGQVQSDWVVAQDDSSPAVAAPEDLVKRVSDLYVRDYIAAWQTALGHIGLTNWSSLEGLQSVLQALTGPAQPLAHLVDAVRINTDLPRRDGPSPSSTAESWPGDLIRAAFAPIDALSQSQAGQPARMSVITDQIGAVYAAMAQIAANATPSAASLHYQSAQQRSQAADTAAVLRNSAATTPDPLRGIMLKVANALAGSFMGDARQPLSTLYRNEMLPGCQAVAGNKYPFVRDARDEVTLKNFTDFFKPGGAVDIFAQALETSGPDGMAGRQQVAAELPPVLRAQLAAAARIQAAFFSNGAEPVVRFSITPRWLDPRLVAATVQIDDQSAVYRHDPPRSIDFTWPAAADTGTARITLQTLRSQATIVDQKGPWALFRMVDATGLLPGGRPGVYGFSIGRNGQFAAFTLTANSTSNAFQLADLRSFRCYDGR